MIRRIHCRACDTKTRPQHPQDVALGWKRRRVAIRTKKPAEHGITIIDGLNTAHTPLPSIVCDACNTPIKDGDEAFALTEWQDSRECEPLNWEQDYSQ